MKNEINEIILLKKMKRVTRKIYYSIISRKGLLKINQQNYLKVSAQCSELFKNISELIDTHKINKSLFLDFFNFQLQVNYCFEMMIENEMTTKEIITLMDKEKDYLDFTFQSIANINTAEL